MGSAVVGSAVVAASVGTGSNVGAGELGAYLQNTDVSIYRGSLLWTQDPRVGAGTGLIVAGLAVGTCEESNGGDGVLDSERGLLSWCVQVELP